MYNALQFDTLIIRPFRQILFPDQASVLGTRLFTNKLLVRTVIKHITLISYALYIGTRHTACLRLSNILCARKDGIVGVHARTILAAEVLSSESIIFFYTHIVW